MRARRSSCSHRRASRRKLSARRRAIWWSRLGSGNTAPRRAGVGRICGAAALRRCASGGRRPLTPALLARSRYDPKRGLVLRVLSGDHEGREFVLSKAALHALRGGAGAGDASAPLLDTVEPCETEAGQPGAKLYWCGGGATVVPLGDFPHLAAAHG